MRSSTWGVLCSILVPQARAIYNPLREYSGSTFFNDWAYYGNIDNTTWGNVTFVDRETAFQQRLTYVNGVGNAIIRVDDVSTVLPDSLVHRNSIRLTSTHSYGIGTLITIDVVHLPYGCSVWPSFWTYGMEAEWPNAGEIDIIEGINNMDHNQMALHALGGCVKTDTPGQQTGTTVERDCAQPKGCLVAETKPNSFGPGFVQAGGGVWAVQYAATGIYIWFWSRRDIPANVANATSTSQIDTSGWGIPTAAYPSQGCDIAKFFPPQNLVLLTTLCGVWAGIPDIYSATCKTPLNSCVADNIIGSGDKYSTAYWEIKYIRTYLSSDTPSTTSAAATATNKAPPVSNSPGSSSDSQSSTTSTGGTFKILSPLNYALLGCLFLVTTLTLS